MNCAKAWRKPDDRYAPRTTPKKEPPGQDKTVEELKGVAEMGENKQFIEATARNFEASVKQKEGEE